MSGALKQNKDADSAPVILALDTSSKRTSMAIAKGPHLITSVQDDADEKRSERLWGDVEHLLGGVGLTINDVNLFSVCTGPGGFTGLRVGIAAIKGFAAATGRQIIGVTSLEAVAVSASPAQIVLSTVSATRGEIYWQSFKFDLNSLPVAQEPPRISTPARMMERIADIKSILFAGDWALTNADLIREVAASRFSERADDESITTGWSISASNRLTADAIAEIAYKKYSLVGGENPEQLRACYVRPSEAEIKLSEGVLGSKLKRIATQE